MEKLNRDEISLILKQLNDDDLFSFCLTNKNLGLNEDFYRNRLINKYGQKYGCLKLNKTWQNTYFLISSYNKKYRIDKALEVVSEKGYLDLVKIFIEEGAKKFDFGMYGAAKGGHKDCIDFYISQDYKEWSMGIYGAARSNNKDLINFFIEQGCDDWVSGMLGAAEGGHKELIEYFVEKGADNWNDALTAAAIGGNKDTIDFVISKGANEWNKGLYGAASSIEMNLEETINLIEYFISKGADDFQMAMIGAASGNKIGILKYFMSKGAKLSPAHYYVAQAVGYKHMIEFIFDETKL